MTRTGKSAKLAGHIAESFVDMHPQDALLHAACAKANWRASSSAWGAMVARVQHGGGIPRGSVFVPIHWSGQTGVRCACRRTGQSSGRSGIRRA
jgi:assimilatory nitrate reductase catalytic subunit